CREGPRLRPSRLLREHRPRLWLGLARPALGAAPGQPSFQIPHCGHHDESQLVIRQRANEIVEFGRHQAGGNLFGCYLGRGSSRWFILGLML
ncbi:MAG TPA: hypothetical protein VKA61_08480, partial [Sphingomicrobium sp.]|nr:hypothetical protein [Sphingomicrobium sp.]